MRMNTVPDIDLRELETLLLEASRSAFINIQQQHPDEHFYAFSLLHEPLWEGIMPASNSEESLLRCAEEYQKQPYYANRSLADVAKLLRWPSGDWTYIEPTNPFFEAVDEWLLRHVLREWVDEPDNKAAQDERYDSIIEVCQNTLRQLDSEGVFGTGEAREKVTLNIMMGDQDPSWLEYARILNPPSVYQSWIQEINDASLYN